MVYATEAEVRFVYTIISAYAPHLKLQTFVDWGKTMEGATQKKLILYTQYLNTTKMIIEEPKQFQKKQEKMYNFLQAIRGNGDQFIEDLVPSSVKVLISECHNLGETLMRQTIRKFSVGDG